MTRMLAAALLLALVHTQPVRAQTLTIEASRTDTPPASLDLAPLPAAAATLTFGNPPALHRFEGPLLWTVLEAAHLIDPARHGDAVRQTIRLQGADGYVAILAAGELSPEFEAKPAILAIRMDGQPLPHPRAIIPADHRLGRSVRDVVRVTLDEAPKQPAQPAR